MAPSLSVKVNGECFHYENEYINVKCNLLVYVQLLTVTIITPSTNQVKPPVTGA